MECEGLIPDTVPKTVKQMVLTQVDPSELVPGRFCNVSWDTVVKLDFIDLMPTSYFGLSDDIFKCLGSIQSFRFSSISLSTFSNFTFSGLTNITELDLSDCQNLFWDDIYNMLSVKTNFPKLTHLNISHGNPFVLYLNQDFIDALSTRPIVQLDLSDNSLAVSFTNASRLCTTLKTVLFKDTYTVFESKYFLFGEPCRSVHTVDGSGMRRTVLFFKDLKCVNATISMAHSKFLSAAEVYYLNRVVTYPNTIDGISNCILEFFDTDSIKEFHFTQNNLPKFEVLIRLDPMIKFLNLSSNQIENIHPDAFTLIPSVNAIDLSNNKLHKMHHFESTFLNLFKHNQNLKRIDMSFNRLLNLPGNTFDSNNEIQELYLSNNFIQEITFNITHLLNLTVLDLRFNLIQAFNENSRRFLDSLYENQAKAQSNKSFKLLLEGNPLSCDCSSLEFLQWFTVSPIFARTRHENRCYLDGQDMLIDENAINSAKKDCEKSIRKRRNVLLSILLPITGVSLLALITIYLYRRRQRRLLWQRYADRIHLIRENNAEFEFPVFLSYCSVDNDFVINNVLRPLKVTSLFCLNPFKLWSFHTSTFRFVAFAGGRVGNFTISRRFSSQK
ncbi:MAG: hypothetical protein AB2693_17455 [Candidatus Thiodiazotropha sp.]